MKFSGLAFQMLAVIGLATWGGWKLDQFLKFNFPFFTIFLLICALVGIIYKLIRMLSDNNPDEH